MLRRTIALLGPFLCKDVGARVRCACVAILLLVDVGASTALPYVSKVLIDNMQGSASVVFFWLLFLFGFLWITQKTIAEIQELLFFPLVNEAIRDLGHRVVMHAHAIDLEAYHGLSIGKLISSMRRISGSARGFLRLLALQLVPLCLKLVAALWGIIALGFWGVAPMLMGSVVLIGWGTWRYAQTREQAWDLSDRMQAALQDSLLNTLSVRAAQRFESEALKRLFESEARGWQSSNIRMHAVQLALGGLFGLTAALALGLSAHAVRVGALTLGSFVLLKGQLLALWLPLKSLGLGCRHAAEATIDLKKIFEVLDLPPRKPSSALSLYPAAPWVLEAHNLGFHYPGGTPILHDLSFRLEPGTCTLIYGKSGCGKSTLATLLAGLREPSEGTLLWAGVPLCHAPEAYKNKLYHIPQQAHILNASVRDNICYGLQRSPSEEELLEALQAMGLDEGGLPQGLETRLGDLGVRLSGGERQRLLLTRAYLHRPELLILDETFHALDPAYEAQLLPRLKASIPCLLIISHRDSCLPFTTASIQLDAPSSQGQGARWVD